MTLKRRSFIKTAVTAGTAAILPKIALSQTKPALNKRVIVIGGGFAGATAAKYLSMWSPNTEIIMIERSAQFVSCPQSNLVLGGSRSLQQLTTDYHGLSDKHGVNTIQAEAVSIDTDEQTVTLDNGSVLNYHRLILAPGVDFIYDDYPQLKNQDKVPHAWKAGPQTALLHSQLMAMKQGGIVIMTVPATPFKCPPGPYERACQIAHFFKQNNPTAKLIILDANADIVSKKGLFKAAWKEHYAGLIDYIPNSTIENIDISALIIETEFEQFEADVLNVIPSQKAGKIAEMAGVVNVDKRWCKVDFLTYESTVKSNVHVIGDAIHAKLPKSGHMANAQAKVCAAAIASLLADQLPEQEPVFNNTCYSFVTDTEAVHVAAVYRYNAEEKQMKPMPGSGVSEKSSELEGAYADAWAKNIWADTLM
ncbi:NAD(P)/FAD-dependent oxidoreductase [Pseudomonadota bacterium]|nr:NAD(P)/FAD-dependent oxidoreductase [Pseudomonadota bacterium]